MPKLFLSQSILSSLSPGSYVLILCLFSQPVQHNKSFNPLTISSSCMQTHSHISSSSVLVLIGSHSLCNSFVVNQFIFFTPNGENSLCYTPKKQWEQYGGKKMFCLFFYWQNILPCHAKMAAKNGNGDTLLLVLEATSYQTKIFRHI